MTADRSFSDEVTSFRVAARRMRRYSGGMLDFATRYEAFRRRDPALDGIVFVAVKTTGVYCRPVCPARTPFARNIRFYPSAAAAERAGFPSTRRLRAAFLRLYGRPPSAFRRAQH